MSHRTRCILEVAALVAAFLIAGCGLKENRSGMTMDDARRLLQEHDQRFYERIKGGDQPGVSISTDDKGRVTGVQVTPQPAEKTTSLQDSGSLDASEREKEKSWDVSSYPLGIKLIFAGMGILLCLFAIRTLWGYVASTGVGQGLALGDEALARAVRRLRAAQDASTDPAIKQQHAATIADLEAERGRLKNV